MSIEYSKTLDGLIQQKKEVLEALVTINLLADCKEDKEKQNEILTNLTTEEIALITLILKDEL